MRDQKRATRLRIPSKHFTSGHAGPWTVPLPSSDGEMSFVAATPKISTPIEPGLSTSGHLTRVKSKHAKDQKETWQQRASLWFIAFLYRCYPILHWLGFGMEYTINFLSLNDGPFTILWRLLTLNTRSIVIPHQEADNYYSICGHLDPRVKLFLDTSKEGQKNSSETDTKIFPNEGIGARSTADVCVLAAKLAYENPAVVKKVVEDNWKMHFVGFYNCWNEFQHMKNTQVFVFMDKLKDANAVVVAWRGTEAFNAYDWSTDIDFSWVKFPNQMGIHLGFLEALGLGSRDNMETFDFMGKNADEKHKQAYNQEQEEAKIAHVSPSPHHKSRDEIARTPPTTGLPQHIINDPEKILAYDEITKIVADKLHDNPNAKLFVTGHSLGGALAVLYSTLLHWNGESEITSKMAAVYTFGQPRVGDENFAKFARNCLEPIYYRVVYCNDLVPRVPFDNNIFEYKHFGECVFFNSAYDAWVLDEAPNKNYFSISMFFILHLNAVWELMQSLMIMKKKHGVDFGESVTSIVFRLVGLVFPGMAAHSPCNYVNSVRLGPFPLSKQLKGDVDNLVEEVHLIGANVKDINSLVSSAMPTLPGKATWNLVREKLLKAIK